MSLTQINQQQVTSGFIAAVVAAIPNGSITGSQLSPANAVGLLNNDGSGNLSYIGQGSLAISSSQVSGLGTAAGNNTGDFISSTAGSVTTTNIAASTIVAGNIAAKTITGNVATTAGNIAANTINDGDIQAQGISSASILNNTLSDTQIALQGISAASILNSTITGSKIAASTVTATNLVRNKDVASPPVAAWVLTAIPASDVYLQVFKNGLLLVNGNDYNLAGQTVNIVDTIVGTDVFVAIYEVA